MSAEYSHYHRDYSYKSSRRFNKYQSPKEFTTTYAPKRRTYYEDERDYNDSYKSYDNYDNTRYGYRGYKPRKYQKDTRTCNHGFHLWKTEFLVKNKDQPEVEKKTEEVVSKEKNIEGTSEYESSSGKSTNYVTEDSRKSLDTLGDIEDVSKEKIKGTTTTSLDEILEEREGDNVLREKVKEVNQENDNRVVSQETDESDEEKFSNIDLKVEKKLLENEFDSDGDALTDNHEEEEERPIWEDVDTKQILEDIKKGTDFLSLYPQDILVLSLAENEYKAQETVEEDQDEEEEETEVEDLNTIFALRVLERGFSRPSLEIKNNTGGFVNNEESAKTDNGLLPIILESPNSIYNGSQSAFLPTQYGLQTPVNKPIFKKFTEDYDATQWYYTGNDGLMQGPFTSRQMDEWYIMGYLPLDLEINLKESKGFRRLRELVDIARNEGDFLFNNMKEIINWFNQDDANSGNIEAKEEEEEEFPPGIPISPRKLAARKNRMEPQTAGLLQQEKRILTNKECVSASLMGPKRLAAFNVYNQEELDNENCYSINVESHCKLPRNDSPLNSGVSNHSYHNSSVNNNCFNPSVLPFPGNKNTVKSPGSVTGQDHQGDLTYAWKSFVNYKN